MPYSDDDEYGYPEHQPNDDDYDSEGSGRSYEESEDGSEENPSTLEHQEYSPSGIASPSNLLATTVVAPPAAEFVNAHSTLYGSSTLSEDGSERDRAYKSSSESRVFATSQATTTYPAASVVRTTDLSSSVSSNAIITHSVGSSLKSTGTVSRVIELSSYTTPVVAEHTFPRPSLETYDSSVRKTAVPQRRRITKVAATSSSLEENLTVRLKEITPTPPAGALLVFSLGGTKKSTHAIPNDAELQLPLWSSRDRILDVSLQDGMSEREGTAALEVPRPCKAFELWLTLSHTGTVSYRIKLLLNSGNGVKARSNSTSDSTSLSSRASSNSSSSSSVRRPAGPAPRRKAGNARQIGDSIIHVPGHTGKAASVVRNVSQQKFWLCLLVREGKFLLDPEHDRKGSQLCPDCSQAVYANWPGAFQSSQRQAERHKMDASFHQELNSLRSLYSSNVAEKDLLRAKDLEIGHLRDRLRQLEINNDDVIGQLLLSKQIVDEKKRQAESAQREMETLRLQLAESERRRKETDALLAASESDVQQVRRELLEYKAWRSKTESTIGRLQREAEERAQESQRHHDANTRLKQEVQREKLSLTQIQREIYESADERNHSERRVNGEPYIYIAGDRRLVDKQLAEITELKMKNSELLNELNHLRGKQAIYEEERKRLVDEVETLELTVNRHSTAGRRSSPGRSRSTSPRSVSPSPLSTSWR
eukprot:TRINITY_DN2808_c0_g1_i1.p1 TRINITY_DN2808_c0_g1~~TRINITY_DN2808_c0_g1_i1.p1  ORF type:complete len:707 (-),score=98.16 TRINITY_DN2808_c0_g1_i1:49-2169(-)